MGLNIGKFFKKLFGIISFPFTRGGLNKINDALRQVEGLVDTAFSIVSGIALVTPNRTDDEIIAAAKKYTYGAVDAAKLLAVKNPNPADVLRSIAQYALRGQAPAGTRSKVINMAIETAVVLMEGKKTE